MLEERQRRGWVPDTPSWFIWDNPGQPLAVHINALVIDWLASRVKDAFKSVPKRGLEIGGILLGRIVPGRPEIVIEDFEPFDSEHQYGPSWLLSPADRPAFAQALDRWRNTRPGELCAVGFFRSHTRPGFDFDDQDRDLFFSGGEAGEQIFLLIKPSLSELPLAQIGIGAAGPLSSATTFPLNSAALRQAGVLVEEDADGQPVAPGYSPQASNEAPSHPAPPNYTAPPINTVPPSHPALRGQYVPPSVLGIAAFLGFAALAAALFWPHKVPVIQTSLIRPSTEISAPEPAQPDPVNSGQPETPPLRPPSLALPGDNNPDDGSETRVVHKRWSRTARNRDAEDPVHTFAPSDETPDAEPEKPEAPPRPSPPPDNPVARPQPPAAQPQSHIATSVSSDPVRPRRFRRVLSKLLPVVPWKGFRSQPKAVSPRPVIEVKPQITATLAERIHGEQAADIKVEISPDGHVSHTELLSDNNLLAEPARAAARQWVFEPARVGDRPVESEAILHFRVNEFR